MVFSLAHLSDLHLAVPRTPALPSLASKRLLSWRSWRRSRRHVHRPEVLAELMADVRAHAPDHLAVTGDLTNLALPEEFEQARCWLTQAGPPEAVTVIPGNHDALVATPWEQGLGRWTPWLGDEDRDGPELFPFLRVRGGAAFIGLSSAVPTAPLLATGRLGPGQLERLEALLLRTGHQGLFRMVLIHHPPVEGAVSKRKALTDGAALRAVLARAGAELVLHGHAHRARLDPLPGPGASIPSLGIGSASAVQSGHGDAAGWRLLSVSGEEGGWLVRSTLRRLKEGGGFETAGRWSWRTGRTPPQ